MIKRNNQYSFNMIVVVIQLLFTCTWSVCATDEWDDAGTCKLCSYTLGNCARCSDGSTCTLCDPGYSPQSMYNGDVRCSASGPTCSTNCNTCISSVACTQCDATYHLYTDSNGDQVCFNCDACLACYNSNCSGCISGYFHQTTVISSATYGHCSQCEATCASCDSYTPCTACNSNQYISGNGTCQSCPVQCHCVDYDYCTSCVDSYFLNNTSGQCQVCPNNCVCENSTYCPSCDAGYYLNAPGECLQCPSNCNCDNSTYCSSCSGNSYRTNTSGCQECPPLCACDNFDYCTGCSSNAFRNDSGDCEQCPGTCLCQNEQYCSSCILGTSFDAAANICLEVCGDGVAINASCDLGPGNDLDGCTDQCQVEDGFNCYLDPATAKSICSYERTVQFSLKKLQKELFQNKISMEFEVKPNLHAFKSIDPNSFLSFNDSAFLEPTFVYNEEDSTFSVSFSFTQDIYKRPFKLMFSASSTIDQRFWATNNTEWEFLIDNDDPLVIASYSDTQYLLSKIIFFISIFLTASAVLICFLGVFSPNRLAGLEILFVLQYGYICLLWLSEEITLPFYCLQNLKYSTGYNYPFEQITSSNNPPHAYTFAFNAHFFFSNFNVMGILYVVPLIPILVTKIIHAQKKEMEQRLIAEDRVQISCQFALYTCLANLVYFTTCFSIFYVYSDSLSHILSQALAISFLLVNVFNFVGFACYSAYYLRFRVSFQRTKLGYRHYFFHILALVSSVLFICLLPSLIYLPFIPQTFMVVYTLVYRPYKYLSENFRSAYNYLCMMVITSMLLFYGLASTETRTGMAGYIYPFVVEAMILVGIIWAYVVVFKDIYLSRIKKEEKKNQNLAYQMFQDEKFIKKYNDDLLHSDLFRARNIIKSVEMAESSRSPLTSSRLETMEQKSMETRKGQKKTLRKQVKTEEQMLKWLKNEKLPNSNEAVQMVMSEAQFIRYYNLVWKNKDKHLYRMKQESKRVYDAI